MLTSLKELYINYNYNLTNINEHIIHEKEILDIFNIRARFCLFADLCK
jgi:hypothetical protein